MALGVDQTGFNMNLQFGVGTSFSVPHMAGVLALSLPTWLDISSIENTIHYSSTAMKTQTKFGVISVFIAKRSVLASRYCISTAYNEYVHNSMNLGKLSGLAVFGKLGGMTLGDN
jgi:hypothetical protein